MTAVLDAPTEAIVTRARMIAELSQDERGDALLRVAEYHLNGHFTSDEIAGIVHQLAPANVPTPLLRFEDLVEALRDRTKFLDDPGGYLDQQDRPVRSFDAEDEQQQQNVDYCLWQLIHPQPPCTKCVKCRTRKTWQQRDGLNLYCCHHRSLP